MDTYVEINFKFRVLREKARVNALINNPQMSQIYFDKSEEILGKFREKSVKFAKL